MRGLYFKVRTVLVQSIFDGTVETKLTFLYSGEFVKNSSAHLQCSDQGYKHMSMFKQV